MVQMFGMIQGRGGLRLPLKTRQGLRILRHIIRQELERDKAVQVDVFRLVNNAHATAAEPFNNAIVGDKLVDHKGFACSACRES